MAGIARMVAKGPITPCKNGGMVGTTMAGVGPPLVGSRPIAMCAVARGPLGPRLVGPTEGIPRIMGGKGTIPLPTIPPRMGYEVHQPWG